MEKFSYILTTLSSLIISPRASTALYETLGDFSLNQISDEQYLQKDKLRVIYPFYQYGEYTKYEPEKAEYYLPGSSIKGAFCQGRHLKDDFMVDDISVRRESIVLRNLYKIQLLDGETKACFGAFFENVGVEMIKAEEELKGELYLKNRAIAKEFLESASEVTQLKISQMLEYIGELKTKGYKDDLLSGLERAYEELSKWAHINDVFLLGGYKGLMHSLVCAEPIEETDQKGAIYLDCETRLPHGLVKIQLI